LRDTAVGHEGAASTYLHLARAVIGSEGRAKPTVRPRVNGRPHRPRYGKPRHVRSAKGWARATKPTARQGRIARRAVRRTAVQVAAATGATGVASFYGGRFHGRLTASGVRFNANAMTAAHRSLPFGTRVRVTHLGNGRTVDVHINDRGPYVGGRIIDLSQGAAGVLGMHGQGVARVQVTVLGR
jgi:rare lipoprotein A